MKARWLTASLVVSFLAISSSAMAAPFTIQYLATDLSDVVGGEDLWRYSYSGSGFSFQANQGFSVYFDDARYLSLQSPVPAPNADWDVLTYQPDNVLNSPGVYDAFALANNASLTDLFVVDFVWLGLPGTQPGSQPFDVYEDDGSGQLSFLESGVTTPAAVPEPSTLLMVAIGAVGLAVRVRRRLRI